MFSTRIFHRTPSYSIERRLRLHVFPISNLLWRQACQNQALESPGRLSRARAEPDHRQARTPVRKTVAAADPRPETEKLADAIDLHVGGVRIPFKVFYVRDKGGCKHVKIYAHKTADDDGDPDATNDKSGRRTRIEVSLLTGKW
ncbi:uncharacterized protein LY79DRAFT_674827 [Colletotrichum navitas]|uniref:Uncharacterized protein n=1 Tax=Colletotrichum navitas TaxID=681940 RepID=A0AAD8PKT0_9PEZI|nr:uncharacterized protein LY79DRAFT_674827 [Colletotrichum navitas]KAK1566274.1 hypothetical protein LY79DRAFT_674827 [Colletotrichum navitas]